MARLKGEGIAPIPGTKRVSHLVEDVEGADMALSAADVAHLDELFAPANIVGKRYPPALAASIDSD